MGIEAQILYAGVGLGSAAVRIDDDGRAFLTWGAPLPVGTKIGLRVGGRETEGRIDRVVESSGAEAGMLVAGVDLELLRAPPAPEPAPVAAAEKGAFSRTIFAPGGIDAADLVAAAKAARAAAVPATPRGDGDASAAPVPVAETVTGAIAMAVSAARGVDDSTPTPTPVGTDGGRRSKKKKRR